MELQGTCASLLVFPAELRGGAARCIHTFPMSATTRKPMTLTQKILAAHAIGPARGPGCRRATCCSIRVDWTIASELAWNGMDRTYQLLGRPHAARTATASSWPSITPSTP